MVNHKLPWSYPGEMKHRWFYVTAWWLRLLPLVPVAWVVIAIVISIVNYHPPTPEMRRAYKCSPKGAGSAGIEAKYAVRARLKAPATADFPEFSYGVTWAKGCMFDVHSYVDAQNGFGAQIRSWYHASVEYRPEKDDWIVWSLKIEP